MRSIAVIGGGWAGLAAAAELASCGQPVTVFEASRNLGGRARGLNWKGKRLDNGQHILVGAYRETLRLMQMAGVDLSQALLRQPLQLVQHGKFSLHAPNFLPAPLHVLSGLMLAKGLGKRERLAALGLMAKLKLQQFRIAHDEPLAGFLARHYQSEHLVHLLWEPLCLAALNTPLAQASTQVFLNVLRDSFAGAKSDSDLLLPRRDLGQLFAEPASAYIQAHGGSIRLGKAVTAIRQENSAYVIACGEEEQHFSHVIVAVPPYRLAELVAALPMLNDAASMAEALAYQPIFTVYLQFPQSVELPIPMTGMTGGHTQWVLDRGLLCGDAGLLAAVISAEGPHLHMTQEALASQVLHELNTAFPGLPPPLWHKVIAEKRATFACLPNLKRPPQPTSLPGFYLAGDYTAGDYPGTLEGAVRSGIKCAELLLASPT